MSNKNKDLQINVPKSLTEVVEDKIRQMIVGGDLEFGQQVTETGLSEMFGLSRTPIREALLRLSAKERLVEIKPRSGTFIFSLTEKKSRIFPPCALCWSKAPSISPCRPAVVNCYLI